VLLKRGGPARVDALASELGISPQATHRHLDALRAEGLVEATTVKGPAGRPHQVYALTAQAQARLFPDGYRALAQEALAALGRAGGEAAVTALFRSRSRRGRERLAPVRSSASLAERAGDLARAVDSGGYMASLHALPDGSFELVQSHCPILGVVVDGHSQPCDEELRLYRSVLAAEVERVEHMPHGDCHCTYQIRPRGRPGAGVAPPTGIAR
jgi:predicted ArsR family transcriptional regulator